MLFVLMSVRFSTVSGINVRRTDVIAYCITDGPIFIQADHIAGDLAAIRPYGHQVYLGLTKSIKLSD